MARICVIRQGYFPLDTRVRREVAVLADDGHEVDVICVRRAGEKRRERLGRVRIHRLDLPLRRGGRLSYVWQYGVFLLAAGMVAAVLGVRRRWDVVQVNSIPDALVFAAAVPRLLGARVLLDLHECMPEFLATKYGLARGHPVVRLLARLEQASIRFADEAITCTEQMRGAFVRRGAPAHRITVVLNAADEAVFDVRRFPPAPRRPGRFTLLCHGAMEERYGLDTLIRAVALLDGDVPGLGVELYGEGRERDELQRLAARLGVADRVRFSDGFVAIDELLRAIADADAGVVAMKRDAFRDLTHCNKMFDFIAMRRPAIVSRTTSVQAYFPGDCFAMFTAGDEHDLARAIRELHDAPGCGERLVARAAAVSEPYRWVHQRRIYAGVIGRLAAPRRPTRTRPWLGLLLAAAVALGAAGPAKPPPAGAARVSAPKAIVLLAEHPRFRTRPSGAVLPTGRTCARRVARTGWEPRPGNATANRTRGARLVLPAGAWPGFSSWRRLAARVDGDFTGTTDEIIRWASCKWGFDENVSRAQAYVESRWDQRFVGDGGRSVGLMQIKSASPGTPHRYTWPLSRTSTAFNLDYALAWRRACYDGRFTEGGWLPASSRGDLWGCIGLWYSGAWQEGDGQYVAEVRRALRQRPWLTWRGATVRRR